MPWNEMNGGNPKDPDDEIIEMNNAVQTIGDFEGNGMNDELSTSSASLAHAEPHRLAKVVKRGNLETAYTKIGDDDGILNLQKDEFVVVSDQEMEPI